MGYRVEVGPIIARAVGRRSGQAAGLPALAALLLASFSITFSIAVSTAVAALAPGLPGGGNPVIGAATPRPNAAPARADVLLLPLGDTSGSADLDVLSGYLRATPAAESVGVAAVTVGVSGGPDAPGAERRHRTRAPPHTR